MTSFNRIARSLAVVLAASLLCQFSRADETAEPQLSFTVQIGDSSIPVVAGVPTVLDGTFTDPEITVTPNPFRTFTHGGMSFKYPSFYVFEADVEDPECRIWTMSGNNLTMMIFLFDTELSTADFSEGLIEQFGRTNTSITSPNATFLLGSQTLPGMTVETTLAGHTTTIDMIRLPSLSNGTRFLMLQDSRDENGKPASDSQRTVELLRSSFKITE